MASAKITQASSPIRVNVSASEPVVIRVFGTPGPQGKTGLQGPGVPNGGTAGQFLGKKSDADLDTEWFDVEAHNHDAGDINTGELDDARLSANVLKKNAGAVLSAGYAATPKNDGVISGGTYTPTYLPGNTAEVINGGAFTFAAPTAAGAYSMVVAVTNNVSAGVVTFTGFDKQAGDALSTTDGEVFFLYITKLAGKVALNIQAMQ